MTDLQRRVAEEYVIDYNIANAAERAKVQGDNKRITAWQMLQIPEVMDYVEQLQNIASEKSSISKQKVIAEIARVAFSDIRKYYKEDDVLVNICDLDDDAAAALAGLKTYEETIPGTSVVVGINKEIKLYDKLGALEKLARHLGLYGADNGQKATSIQVLTNDPLSGE